VGACRSPTSSCTGTSRRQAARTSPSGRPDSGALSWKESTWTRSGGRGSSTPWSPGAASPSRGPAGSAGRTSSRPRA
jgi:hypothetical protein